MCPLELQNYCCVFTVHTSFTASSEALIGELKQLVLGLRQMIDLFDGMERTKSGCFLCCCVGHDPVVSRVCFCLKKHEC